MLDIRLDDFWEERVKELQTMYREPSGTAVIRLLVRNASQEMGRWPGVREEDISEEALAQEYQALAAVA